MWLPADFIKCIHPGWELLTGWERIMESWRLIFENTVSIHFDLGRRRRADPGRLWLGQLHRTHLRPHRRHGRCPRHQPLPTKPGRPLAHGPPPLLVLHPPPGLNAAATAPHSRSRSCARRSSSPVGYTQMRPPPSSRGLGHGPFKAATRIRIPSGAPPLLVFLAHGWICFGYGWNLRHLLSLMAGFPNRGQGGSLP